MQTRNLTDSKLGEIDVVILCGGLGSRLCNVVHDRPKPMAGIGQRPFLDILINQMAGFGLRRFVLCTGHMSEVIRDYCGQSNRPVEFIISDEQAPLGTAGTIKNAEGLIHSEPFLVTNGDSYCSVDLAEFYESHVTREALMSMVVVESEDSADYGLVCLDRSQKIVGFKEKGEAGGGFVNAGIYLFRREILSLIPAQTEYSLEYELFPRLVGRNCYAFVSHEQLIDIGTPQRYEWAAQIFANSPIPADLR